MVDEVPAGEVDAAEGGAAAGSEGAARPPLEIGILLAAHATSREKRLVRRSVARLRADLERWFPGFAWSLPVQERRDVDDERPAPSATLLRLAAEAREAATWDFALLVTPAELVARYRSFALAALSRPLDAAVVSTSRIVVEASADARSGAVPERDEAARASDDDVIVDRLATLLLHAVAHLGGVPAARERDALLYRPRTPGDLDRMSSFDGGEIVELNRAFADIADARLEEIDPHPGPRSRFVLRAAWINREEIGEAVLAARPWEFPLRLSRLTTAAVSTVAILLMTAESWDLGLSQGHGTLVTLALLVLGLTSAFVVARQHLLLARGHQLREQLVVSGLSAILIVVAGLAVTWACMFALALLASATLFPAGLVAGWAASLHLAPTDIGASSYLKMSTWCASLGLLIGSLGASFEDQQHFQHIIFVDEEL